MRDEINIDDLITVSEQDEGLKLTINDVEKGGTRSIFLRV